ncbi:alpha/beta fold hydrolase [Streptomyces sp. NPDC005820]|uniref:alpha/beta fold hydrolase n=1 Tax=Streptomyces sp. NPDC005820 TaxID=3157069 RepID=UPI00340E93B2
MRGHGESDKPGHGYRIARPVTDLHDVLVALACQDVTLVAHSMRCSVTWAYWDLFGGERLGGLVLVDQLSVLVADPAWAEGEAAELGAIFDNATVSSLNAGLKGPAAADVSRGLVASMFTPATPAEEIEWTIEVNSALPRADAGTPHRPLLRGLA